MQIGGEHDEDVGKLDVGPTKIEIKATRSDSVSLSGVQAAAAAGDSTHYWLCVVAFDSDEVTGTVNIEFVCANAFFVERIGETLSGPRGDLDKAIETAREEGIELEHVDAIRFRVQRDVWVSRGVRVVDFVRRILGRG